jgi:hypothetical protein
MFRVYLPQSLLQEAYEHAKGRPPDTEIVLSDFAVLADTAVERLVQALVYADNYDEAFGRVYLDGLGLAIASRLIATHLHIKGVHEEDQNRSMPELESYRDEILLGLLELRKKEA